MDWTKVGGLLVSPLAKKTILLTVISVSSLLEVCFFTAPSIEPSDMRGGRGAILSEGNLISRRENSYFAGSVPENPKDFSGDCKG